MDGDRRRRYGAPGQCLRRVRQWARAWIVRGRLAARRSRRRYVRVELVLAVGELVGACGCTHEGVETERQEVVLAVFYDRRQILLAQSRRMFRPETAVGLD